MVTISAQELKKRPNALTVILRGCVQARGISIESQVVYHLPKDRHVHIRLLLPLLSFVTLCLKDGLSGKEKSANAHKTWNSFRMPNKYNECEYNWREYGDENLEMSYYFWLFFFLASCQMLATKK